MDFKRAHPWLLLLVITGCGNEFSASDAGNDGVGANHDSAVGTADAGRDGTAGAGGRDDASATGGGGAGGSAQAGHGGSDVDARAAGGGTVDGGAAETSTGRDTGVDRAAIETGTVVTVDTGVMSDASNAMADANVDATSVRTDAALVDAVPDRFRGCPASLPGPALVEVPAPSGGTYCIDSTEVTNAQYAAFLAASNGSAEVVGAQDPWCSWNTSFVPLDSWPTARDNFPVISVNWCDAYAYCKWAGKTLCGKIGGGSNLPADANYAPLDAWYNACTQSSSRAFPYGDAYGATTCNGVDNGAGEAVAVGSKSGCAGGYAGLVDMSGNLAEWEDSCSGTTGPDDTCRLRGGAFINGETDLRCDMVGATYRNFWYHFAGIRCCAPSL